MITFCASGSALLRRDLTVAPLADNPFLLIFYFGSHWTSKVGQAVMEIAGSFLTLTDSVTLWHIRLKAHTKCSFPLCESHFLFVHYLYYNLAAQ